MVLSTHMLDAIQPLVTGQHRGRGRATKGGIPVARSTAEYQATGELRGRKTLRLGMFGWCTSEREGGDRRGRPIALPILPFPASCVPTARPRLRRPGRPAMRRASRRCRRGSENDPRRRGPATHCNPDRCSPMARPVVGCRGWWRNGASCSAVTAGSDPSRLMMRGVSAGTCKTIK